MSVSPSASEARCGRHPSVPLHVSNCVGPLTSYTRVTQPGVGGFEAAAALLYDLVLAPMTEQDWLFRMQLFPFWRGASFQTHTSMTVSSPL